MLTNLHIKNMALVDEADVDFSEGLNILTGETGAGKSIIVDSIGLALGGRAVRDMRRDGETSLVELTFETDDPATVRALDSLDAGPDDGQIIISRRFQDGRSTIRVNGMTKPAAAVREIASLLIDIHGQSEHQKLLRPERQLALLDEYGRDEIGEAKEKTASDYAAWRKIHRELGGEEIPEKERAARVSFLEYEIQEIEEASLQAGEDEELEKTYRKLLHAQRIAEAVGEAHELTGYDSAAGAGSAIGAAVRRIESVISYDEHLEPLSDELREIDSLLNDFNRDLAEYSSDLTYEDGALEETEERLNTINKLKAKYGRTIPAVLRECGKKKQELQRLADYEENRRRLTEEEKAAEKRLAASSAHLTELRKKYAVRFAADAVREFRDLNFARADFAVEFGDSGSYSANGRDAVEFTIATNPGEPRRPLRAVVSGGELSRLMLGIRTMFADTDSTGTIIFDEVDSGISGRTAQKAAEKMARVARKHQVICITHLPQIAAMADAHYGITKSVTESAAVTAVRRLGDRESSEEIARLIGGAEITENTLSSAREMKEMCRQYKHDVL